MDTEKLKELLAAATPGPWGLIYRGSYGEGREFDISGSDGEGLDLTTMRGQMFEPDAALIVAAVNALPSLLARLDNAEFVLRELLAVADKGVINDLEGFGRVIQGARTAMEAQP